MTIFLCGFMGCGKSTVGEITAKKIGYIFCDTDDMIVKDQKMSIPNIFDQNGEPYFREVEARIVKSTFGRSAVIACGGGAMLNSNSAKDAYKAGNAVIFLDVNFETCYNRIRGDRNRPIAVSSTKDDLFNRFRKRRDIYIQNSTIRIECCMKRPIEIAELIVESVKKI